MTTPHEMDYDEWSKLAPWSRFQSDLVLTIHHLLSEPTCPTARISFEIPARAGYETIAVCCGDSVEEAVHLVSQKAKEVLSVIMSVSEDSSKEDLLRALKMGFWLEKEIHGFWRIGLGVRKDLPPTRVSPEVAEELVSEGSLKARALDTTILYVVEK
jgi:hypothetical protein